MKYILILLFLTSTLFAQIGKIGVLKGSAEIQRDKKHISAVIGASIEEKDEVQTAKRSKLQVMLNDDTIITIGPQTTYTFESFDDKNDPHVKMQIKRGFFKAVSGEIGKIAPKRFKIKTNSATIGIRGTQFMGYIEEGYEKVVCVRGEIQIFTHEGRILTVKAGEMVVLRDGNWTVLPMALSELEPLVFGLKNNALEDLAFKQEYLHDTYKYSELIIQERSADLAPFNIDFNSENEVILPPFIP